MNTRNGKRLALLVGLLVVLFAAAFAPLALDRFDWIVTKRLTVLEGGMTLYSAMTSDDTISAEQLTSTDDATVADDLTVSGDAVVGDDLRVTPQTSVTITQGATLTPTGTYQALVAAGSVSFGSIITGTAGDMLYLVNLSNVTITITDTGSIRLSGNAALGQYDSLMLWSDGTSWIQVAPESDN